MAVNGSRPFHVKQPPIASHAGPGHRVAASHSADLRGSRRPGHYPMAGMRLPVETRGHAQPGGINAFLADGYTVIRGAVPAMVVTACQDIIWSELEQCGVRRADPSTWTAPVVRIVVPKAARSPRQVRSGPAPEACDQPSPRETFPSWPSGACSKPVQARLLRRRWNSHAARTGPGAEPPGQSRGWMAVERLAAAGERLPAGSLMVAVPGIRLSPAGRGRRGVACCPGHACADGCRGHRGASSTG